MDLILQNYDGQNEDDSTDSETSDLQCTDDPTFGLATPPTIQHYFTSPFKQSQPPKPVTANPIPDGIFSSECMPTQPDLESQPPMTIAPTTSPADRDSDQEDSGQEQHTHSPKLQCDTLPDLEPRPPTMTETTTTIPADRDSDQEHSGQEQHTHYPKLGRGKKGKYALPKSELPQCMAKFFEELGRYFLKPVNLERQKAPINETTFDKIEERLLCYLGYAKCELHLPLQADLFLRQNVIEMYLSYLKEFRKLSSATIANHAASLLYPAKFLHGERSPQFAGVTVITQLRAQVAYFQKEGNSQRPSKKEDLEALNKWLDWPEIVRAVELQRERFDLARSSLARATECADLLLLSLYILMPPSRGMEIRTLELLPPTLSVTSPLASNKNLVMIDDAGQVTFKFQNYKTMKTYGCDTTILEPAHEISSILRDYLKTHRSQLLKGQDNTGYLLVNKAGNPYTSASFSAHLKFLFHRLTGVSLSVNVLRSSFLTHAYGLSECTDSTKDSLAAALRHSRRHAQQTYDKRSANERKGLAMSLASQFAESGRKQVETSSATLESESSLKVGDFVGLVEASSTTAQPRVLIAQIQSFLPDCQVRLLWYDETEKKGEYVFKFDADPWIENIDALHPIKMTPMNKRPGLYKLKSSFKSIHKALS